MSLDRISPNSVLPNSENRQPWTHGDAVLPRTVTRADLADAVVRQFGLSHAESRKFVEDILAEIADALVRGENIKLSGFGSFNQRTKSARPGRNPRNGAEATISPRRVLSFKPSHILRRQVGEL
ncbi:integration host factor subunit alpha [uncultured Rhodoblastus sp.]|uniref:integration host factor subunit alpha n=1 Tax=uncultured Rhodoblastus sp. TaxID=543037 RepID=UPI0025F4580D|nr:integration host factor subunit alpha [uncultured Rhodoblastus sp.]